MDTLDDSQWDVLIVGTGLQQALLALALSRSDKKILHIDENRYYGGGEAALSLLEAEEWAERTSQDSSTAAFRKASIHKPSIAESDASTPSLSPSRHYNLALCPQIIYARSTLLQYLVSSKVYRHLEFLAVGTWWVYAPETGTQGTSDASSQPSAAGKLLKVPNGREDVFQNHDLDFKAKRALMKFLRFIAEYEDQTEVWEEHRSQSFPAFLSEQFKVPVELHAPLLALTLSSARPDLTTTEYALPRIARHLRSIGVFGTGFGAVIPKYGGLSEISQVACRASAVGGGVYVLPKGVVGIEGAASDGEMGVSSVKLRLQDEEAITARWVVGEHSHDPPEEPLCKSISVVASSLETLFPPIAEEAPSPASAVVTFPSGSLLISAQAKEEQPLPPVNIHIHSSDTGECPAGQCILYASTSIGGDVGFQLLEVATSTLLLVVDATPSPTLLWSLQYEHHPSIATSLLPATDSGNVLKFPPPPSDLAFDDAILGRVKGVWQTIIGDDAGEFLTFEDREAYGDDDE